MAREQAVTTIDPTRFATGGLVTSEDAIKVIKQLNWSYGHRPQLHVSLTTAPAAWASSAPTTLDISFRALASGAVQVMLFCIYVQPEVVTVACGAECSFAGTEAGDVVFTAYAIADVTLATPLQTVTLNFAAADNATEKSGNLATATTGTGWLIIKVTVETTAQDTTRGDLYTVRVQDNAITSSLPAPLIEDQDGASIPITTFDAVDTSDLWLRLQIYPHELETGFNYFDDSEQNKSGIYSEDPE